MSSLPVPIAVVALLNLIPKSLVDPIKNLMPRSVQGVGLTAFFGSFFITSSLILSGTYFLYSRNSKRQTLDTGRETVVIIGGGYGLGAMIAHQLNEALYCIAAIDDRDTDGRELPSETRAFRRAQEQQWERQRRDRERRIHRLVAQGTSRADAERQVSEPARMDEYCRIFKANPAKRDEMVAVLQKIRASKLARVTHIIWVYTPRLQHADRLYQSYRNAMDVFLPEIEPSPDGGVLITIVSGVAHVHPPPPYLHRLAREHAAVRSAHLELQTRHKEEGMNKIAHVLIDLGHFDERHIDVGTNHDDNIRIISQRAKEQIEQGESFDSKLRVFGNIRPVTEEQRDALAAAQRRNTQGFFARTIDDETIAMWVHDAIVRAVDVVLYRPMRAGVWEWVGRYVPLFLQRLLWWLIGADRTMCGLRAAGEPDEAEMGTVELEKAEWERQESEWRRQDMRRRELRGGELLEREIVEREMREGEVLEREMREQEMREREMLEQEMREQEMREQEMRERERPSAMTTALADDTAATAGAGAATATAAGRRNAGVTAQASEDVAPAAEGGMSRVASDESLAGASRETSAADIAGRMPGAFPAEPSEEAPGTSEPLSPDQQCSSDGSEKQGQDVSSTGESEDMQGTN
ncbi:hypothetical protein KEM52_003002 [Ascosphaera acerosa]|nr:hypothetical protein KEM52_003002 [Ascosphaera acerosa]